jgi:hypothetical protein
MQNYNSYLSYYNSDRFALAMMTRIKFKFIQSTLSCILLHRTRIDQILVVLHVE